MSRYGHSSEREIGGIAALLLVLMVIAAILSAFACYYIAKTFFKYHKDAQSLWWSLGVGAVLVLIAWLLSSLDQQFWLIAAAAPVQLFLVCTVVQRTHSKTLMRQNFSVMEDIVKKQWWKDAA